MFDFVCDRLGYPSDLAKSWGGGECDSIILCMSSGARALLLALCLQVHTNGGKLGYIYSSGRPHGAFVFCVCREDWIYIDGLYESAPDSYVKYSVINGPTDGL